MKFPAHIRIQENGQKEIQTVAEHCQQCAEYASENTNKLKGLAYLAGILHDFGKPTETMKDYLNRAAAGEQVVRGSVNHTFAGVRFVMERWHSDKISALNLCENLSCEIIAYVIGSHHGMFDCINPDGEDGFLHRLTKEGIHYEEAKINYLSHVMTVNELDKLFQISVKEMTERFKDFQAHASSEEELRFYIGLMARMLLSNVIDADRRDTAEFMNGIIYPKEIQEKEQLKKLWSDCLDKIEQRLSDMDSDTPMNQVRRFISEQCAKAARRGSGIYRLSVPTGGGKTLASLRYALTNAKEHSKKRIFFVIPLLSVLEQNAKVIRDWIADDKLILEHHSNVVREEETDGKEELNDKEFLIDTWNAPIVITTLVQLLNTLFSGKSSCVRRMHALEDSVIIIDEVQSVPRKLLTLFNFAMNFLANHFGATIVLASATQPYLEGVKHPVHYVQEPDLVKMDEELLKVFQRTEIIDRRKSLGYTAEEIAQFAVDCMEQQGSALVICNTKKQASEVFRSLSKLAPVSKRFHLSTAMCMAHRKQTLEAVNKCLDDGERVICIATQLVEAGVDFSFASVIRVSAGLDSIIQAAGRCNRSGEKQRICNVYIVNYKGENLDRLKEIKLSQKAAEQVLYRFQQDKKQFDDKLDSDIAIQDYYRCLYTELSEGAMDYHLKKFESSLYIWLSTNKTSKKDPSYLLSQAFKSAGKEFTVFDDQTYDVLVPYGGGMNIITQLSTQNVNYDFHERIKLVERAKEFTISLYEYQVKKLSELGGIYKILDDSVQVLQVEFYDKAVGFSLEGENHQFWEV